MSEAGVIRGRKKRRQRRHQRNRRKMKIALAVLRLLEFLHHASRGAYSVPAHAVFARHHEAGIQCFRVAQDFRQQVRLRIAVPGVHPRRAKFFLLRQRVVFLEKRHRLLRRHSFRVLRKRLRRDPNRLHLVSARFKTRLRAPQHLQRIRHLLLILRPIQINERRDRPNLRLLLRRRSFPLRAKNSRVASQSYYQYREQIAEESSQGVGRWTHRTMLLVGAQHAPPHSIQDSPKSLLGWIADVRLAPRFSPVTSHESPVTSCSTKTPQSQ